jgi:hypothetical protein
MSVETGVALDEVRDESSLDRGIEGRVGIVILRGKRHYLQAIDPEFALEIGLKVGIEATAMNEGRITSKDAADVSCAKKGEKQSINHSSDHGRSSLRPKSRVLGEFSDTLTIWTSFSMDQWDTIRLSFTSENLGEAEKCMQR